MSIFQQNFIGTLDGSGGAHLFAKAVTPRLLRARHFGLLCTVKNRTLLSHLQGAAIACFDAEAAQVAELLVDLREWVRHAFSLQLHPHILACKDKGVCDKSLFLKANPTGGAEAIKPRALSPSATTRSR